MRHKCNALFRFFPFRNVLDNDDEMPRRDLRIANDDAACGQNTRMAKGHFNFIVSWIRADHAGERFAVGRIDPFCVLGP